MVAILHPIWSSNASTYSGLYIMVHTNTHTNTHMHTHTHHDACMNV